MNEEIKQQDLHGIVVFSMEYKEHDQIIKLLSQEEGLVSITVHGSKSLKSKFISATQLFSYGVYTVTSKREQRTLKDVKLETTFFHLRDSLTVASLASYFCEIICYTGIEEANTNLLRILLNSLYALANQKFSETQIKTVFEWAIAMELGVMPEYEGCHLCGKTDGDFSLNIPNGTLLCNSCKSTLEAQELADDEILSKIVLLSGPCVHALEYIFNSSIERMFSFHMHENDLKMLSLASEQYLSWHIDHHFSTLDYYKDLL